VVAVSLCVPAVRHVFDDVLNDLCKVIENIIIRTVWIILHVYLGVYTGLLPVR